LPTFIKKNGVLWGAKYCNLKFQFLPRRRHTDRLMELSEIVRNYQENPMKPANTVYGKD